MTPKRIIFLCTTTRPWMAWGALLILIVGILWGFFGPIDYQQKEMVRMIYIHVPSAWFSLMCYGLLALFSFLFLVTRIRLWDYMAFSIAKVGTILTFVCLITGSLWGKPMWGTYWVWDMRLTSMAILQFLYIGYWAFRSMEGKSESKARFYAVFALFGAMNLPIIKWSVTYWATLHQGPSVFRIDGPQIDPAFLWPLLLCTVGMGLYVGAVFSLLLETELLNQKQRRDAFNDV